MRIPVAFDGCFGWLHTPPDGLARDTAVLLCPGILKDAMLAHCSWRLLADRLAEAGYTTLRFDYPGTGDSCDEQFVGGIQGRRNGLWVELGEGIVGDDTDGHIDDLARFVSPRAIVCAVEEDPAAGRLDEPVDHLHGGRLA